MWLLTLSLLWLVPFFVLAKALKARSRHAGLLAGASLGLVVYPASEGLYAFYWMGPVLFPAGFILGMIGLMSTLFHGDLGYKAALELGLIEPRTVVRGLGHLYVEGLGGLCWAAIYGCVGAAIDLGRRPGRARRG